MNRPVAVLFLAVTAVLMLAGVLMSFGREAVFDTLLYGILLPAVLAGSGVLVAGKHPANPIGWLFCGFALFTALAELAEAYGYLAAAHDLPAGAFGEWVITWSWMVETVFWLFIFLLFPDGRFAGRRWRVIAWIGVIGITIALPGAALDSNNDSAFSGGENPFAVPSDFVALLFPVGMALAAVGLIGAVASLVMRLRRARGVERQQLKWFASAAAAMVLVAPFAVIFWYRTTIVALPMTLAICAIPVAATIAILRYRLYDVDVVINRTLVYGGLTATLAAAYLGTVLLLQLVLNPLTERNDLAVAGSTLAVAALFRPARARIQRLVDRRFYRGRYDAARTLEMFTGRLREQLDLEALSADLRGVVRETLQPAHVSLWLPTPERR